MSKGTWLVLAIAAAGVNMRASEPADVPTKVGRSGIEKAYFVAEVRPQDDLFRHVNGKCLAGAPTPPDRSIDGAFHKLRDKSEADIRAIVEAAASSQAPPGTEAS